MSKWGKQKKAQFWLNPDLLSPYEYWQFWRNVDDDDVEKFLKIFTLLPMDEINRLASFKGYETNQAKIVLADQATEILHGKDKLLGIHSTVKSIFDRKGEDDSSLPSKNVSYKEIKNGFSVLDAIISLQFCRSKSEGRQFIRNRIVFINDKIVENEIN